MRWRGLRHNDRIPPLGRCGRSPGPRRRIHKLTDGSAISGGKRGEGKTKTTSQLLKST